MQPRPARTVTLLLAAAIIIPGSMAWPRTAASGGKAPPATPPDGLADDPGAQRPPPRACRRP